MGIPPAQLTFITRLHRFIHRISGGRIGNRIFRPTLFLHTTGRKTGEPRINPLFYVEWRGNWVVVASSGGHTKPPNWWLNIVANPEVSIEVDRQRHDVLAREATPDERAEVWPLLTAMYAGYDDYVRVAQRHVPVVILEPR